MESTGRARRRGAIALVVVGSLLATLSVPALWVNRSLMSADGWVATVAPLSAEPAIQDAVATAVADAALNAIDVRSLAEKYLPSQAQPLAAPIAGAAEEFVRRQSTAFTRSESFSRAWIESNRIGHNAVRATVTQRDGVLANQAGVVSIRLEPVAEAVKKRLVDRGLKLAALVPTSSMSGEIILFSSPALAQAGRYIDYLQKLAFWIPAFTFLAFAGALALSDDRRRATLWIGAGTLVATVLPLQAFYLAKLPLVGAVQRAGATQGSAASVAYDIVFRNLFAAERGLAFVAILLIGGAVLAGPAAFAATLRTALKGGVSELSAGFSFGRFGGFVSANRKALRVAGLLAAAVAALVPAQQVRGIGFVVWVAVLLLLWLAAVEFFGGGSS